MLNKDVLKKIIVHALKIYFFYIVNVILKHHN